MTPFARRHPHHACPPIHLSTARRVSQSTVQMIYIPSVAAAPSPPLLPPLTCPDVCTGNPMETCFYDPTCSDLGAGWGGGLGCNAGGQGQECRFCGFGEFDCCPGSCGDPITNFQGQETRYWLSMEHFTPVFEQGPLALSQLAGPANPPPGLENHKGAWVMATELKIAGLDSILVEAVDPTTLLARPNATAPPAADALTTMRLSFAGKQLKAGEHKLSMSDMTIAVNAKADPDQKIGRGFVEQIDIKAEGLHLRITSSKANKFADEVCPLRPSSPLPTSLLPWAPTCRPPPSRPAAPASAPPALSPTRPPPRTRCSPRPPTSTVEEASHPAPPHSPPDASHPHPPST